MDPTISGLLFILWQLKARINNPWPGHSMTCLEQGSITQHTYHFSCRSSGLLESRYESTGSLRYERQ